jgi:hypothetical protein
MRLALPLAALFILFGLSGGAWHLWSANHLAVAPAGRYLLIPGIILLALSIGHKVLTKRCPLISLDELAHPTVWCAGIAALFFSDWLTRPYSLFQGPDIRGELLLGALIVWGFLKRGWRPLLLALPVIASLLATWSFFLRSNGALLFSDDHAMFLFRLKLLKENFPFIPFWFPLWNGGIDARDFFATGALNAFFLSAPLVYAFPVEQVYNLIIALFLWVVVPLASYLTARKFDSDRCVAAVAALLSMSTTLLWYRWALQYGTVGFIISSAILPLVFALATRFIARSDLTWKEALALILTATLMLLWSPSGMALAPLALIAVPRLKTILSSRRHLLTILLIVAVNLPWMMMMWKVSGVGKFLKSESTVVAHQTTPPTPTGDKPDTTKNSQQSGTHYRHRAGGLEFRKIQKHWQQNVVSMNPLIFALALPALAALPAALRLSYALITGWLLFLGTFGVSLKPQLELDRMVVIATVVLCYPVARFIVSVFKQAHTSRLMKASAVSLGSFLVIGPFTTTSILMNRSYVHYFFASPVVQTLAETIDQNANGGRALFSGCVLHELSGGHLAPLPFWAKTPLIASSYAHNIWRYEQPIPKSFMDQGDVGIRRFFDLMNVTIVTAHEPHWRTYFMERASEYKEIGRQEGFILFSRINAKPSYVIEGEAVDLRQDTNSAHLTPRSERVVLSFKYFPFMTSSHCTIKPFSAAPDLTLIELSGCTPGTSVTLESIKPLERLVS